MHLTETRKEQAMLKGMISAASLLLAMQGVAVAQEQRPDITVSYSDLDLSNAADIRVFDRRIDAAISLICPDQRSVGGLKAMRACSQAKREEIAPMRAHVLASAATRGDAAVAAR
jgi:UrcA family protein